MICTEYRRKCKPSVHTGGLILKVATLIIKSRIKVALGIKVAFRRSLSMRAAVPAAGVPPLEIAQSIESDDENPLFGALSGASTVLVPVLLSKMFLEHCGLSEVDDPEAQVSAMFADAYSGLCGKVFKEVRVVSSLTWAALVM